MCPTYLIHFVSFLISAFVLISDNYLSCSLFRPTDSLTRYPSTTFRAFSIISDTVHLISFLWQLKIANAEKLLMANINSIIYVYHFQEKSSGIIRKFIESEGAANIGWHTNAPYPRNASSNYRFFCLNLK